MRRLRAGDQESGAVAVIAVVAFAVILAMVGVSIDIGAAFAKRQEAQNGADAAALAVASQCAIHRQLTNCPGDYTSAREIALLNERTGDSATVLDGDIQYDTPAAHRVTVTVTAEQPTFFLSILGDSFRSFTVKRHAVAAYGSPIHGHTIPIAGSECVFPDDPPAPDTVIDIELWLPQNSSGIEDAAGCDHDFPSGGFAWLDDGAVQDCNAEIGIGGTIGSDPGAPAPKGCRDMGKTYFVDMVAAGTEFLIPLFEYSEGGGAGAEYVVTRFAVLQFTGFHYGPGHFDSSPVGQRCSNPPEWLDLPPGNIYANSTCIRANLLGYKSAADGFELGGPLTELVFTDLVG